MYREAAKRAAGAEKEEETNGDTRSVGRIVRGLIKKSSPSETRAEEPAIAIGALDRLIRSPLRARTFATSRRGSFDLLALRAPRLGTPL